MNAGAPTTPPQEDVDLTGDPPVAGGPNAAHVNETEEERAERTAAEAKVSEEAANDGAEAPGEDDETWPAGDDPAASAEPSPSASPDGEPTSPTQTDPDSSGEPSGSAAPTGGDAGAEDRSRSGAQQRPYHVLEEQEVVPFHALSEAQQKSLAKHKVAGFIERGEQVTARNTEIALQQVYGEDGTDEHVSRVLPLSERAFQPVALSLEPVQRTRLRMHR